MNRNIIKKAKAFTLVELLIVIVVVAILAAISTLAYNGVNDRATNASAQSALQSAEKAIKLYYTGTGKPLYIEDQYINSYGLNGNQYYLGGNGMVGVCIATEWPSRTAMANEINPNDGWLAGVAADTNSWLIHMLYCGISSGDSRYLAAMMDQIRDSTLTTAFSKMPSMSPVKLAAVRTTGETDNYTIRGVRYAFNGSLTSPVSYLYYAVQQKSCFPGDTSFRIQATVNIGVGPGGTFGGFSETGGDYTSNNSQYCYKRITH